MKDWRDDWGVFCERAAERMVQGETQYGNRTLEGSMVEQLSQLQFECEDIHNYAYMVWLRCERLKVFAKALGNGEISAK